MEPEHDEQPTSGLPFPSAFAFIGSGSLLVLELVAGRILAPVVGVSLYTWTSIIGVVLAGISLGNWIGGRIADRKPTRATLSAVYLLAAIASGLILGIARDPAKFAAPQGWPAIAQVVWISALMFFVPATLLGMPTPIIVKLTLSSLGATGRVVGRVQAFATLGAIVGTFVTGFWLISAFGTRAIVATVAVVLLVLGIASNPVWDRKRAVNMALILVLIAGMLSLSRSQCTVETNYFCIRIERTAEPNIMAMKLDLLIQGFVDLDEPTNLVYSYEKLYEQLLARITTPGAPLDSFTIGGGTYTFPRWLQRYHPGRVAVAEIDPAVTEAARRYLKLDPSGIEIHHDDARRVFARMTARDRFDVVLGDAFNDLSVPYHLTTVEFAELVRAHLKPGGVYMTNVVDGVEHEFLRSYVRTLRRVFPYAGILAEPDAWPLRRIRKTFVVVAGYEEPPAFDKLVPTPEIDAFLAGGPSVLLTDDHVPTDQLLAPLFEQRLRG